MAAGAWSGTAVLAATVTNANPFRREGAVAEPRHFDPFQLLAQRPVAKQEPQLRVRVGQLKHLFEKDKRGQ
jgi:hypothetical protein